MMKMGILFLTLSLAAYDASAADSGFYIGASFGNADVNGVAKTSQGIEFSTPIGLGTIGIASAGLNGVPFDDNDLAFGGMVGYRINSLVSLQLSAARLGEFTDAARIGVSQGASLKIDEYAFSAKLHHSLTQSISANWWLGLSHNNFSAGGNASIVTGLIGGGGLITVSAPYSDPGSEIGYLFGFGFDWAISPIFSLDLNYKKHDTRVIIVDTLEVGLLYSF